VSAIFERLRCDRERRTAQQTEAGQVLLERNFPEKFVLLNAYNKISTKRVMFEMPTKYCTDKKIAATYYVAVSIGRSIDKQTTEQTNERMNG